MKNKSSKKGWKYRIHEIVYEADTPAGKFFDVVLLLVIIASIVLVMLESVKSIDSKYHDILNILEWIITILFTIEYIARVSTVKKPLKYVLSFYGIIDLLSTLPKYLSLFFVGTHVLVALRGLRLLRIFRIFKLSRYLGASNNLLSALKASRPKILVFLYTVVIMAIIFGTLMYIVESNHGGGFTNIPKSIYWSIVTLTTVGFGDITPVTPLGQFIASIIMILGYGIIAVPTGIISAEYTYRSMPGHLKKSVEDDVQLNSQSCANCLSTHHLDGSKFCAKCGYPLYIED